MVFTLRAMDGALKHTLRLMGSCGFCLHLSSAGQVRVRQHRGLPCAELCRSRGYNFPAWLRELFESFLQRKHRR